MRNKGHLEDFGGLAVIICLIVILFSCMYFASKHENELDYRRGQIDAINGFVIVEKIQKLDNTISWGFKNNIHLDIPESYKQGQVDYLNGIIKYELTENDKGEKFWKKIEDKE